MNSCTNRDRALIGPAMSEVETSDLPLTALTAEVLPPEVLALKTERRQRFVRSYVLNSGNAAQAVRESGYSIKGATTRGYKLLKEPDIKVAIDALRRQVATRTGYGVDKAMSELEEAMTFAKKTENATAFVRAVELRAKLNGVLVDRLDARVAVGAFVINVEGMGNG